jgi:hypothetical protein
VIVLRAVRVEDGSETELGEVRLTEAGTVYSHLSTAEGGGVVGDLVSRLRSDQVPRQVKTSDYEVEAIRPSLSLRREVPRPLRPLVKAHPRKGTLQ